LVQGLSGKLFWTQSPKSDFPLFGFPPFSFYLFLCAQPPLSSGGCHGSPARGRDPHPPHCSSSRSSIRLFWPPFFLFFSVRVGPPPLAASPPVSVTGLPFVPRLFFHPQTLSPTHRAPVPFGFYGPRPLDSARPCGNFPGYA